VAWLPGQDLNLRWHSPSEKDKLDSGGEKDAREDVAGRRLTKPSQADRGPHDDPTQRRQRIKAEVGGPVLYALHQADD